MYFVIFSDPNFAHLKKTVSMYKNDTSQVVCTVCHDDDFAIADINNDSAGIFNYPNHLSKEFTDEDFISMEFRNLKKNIKRHIHTSTTHKKKKLDEEQEEAKIHYSEIKTSKQE